MKNVRNYNEKLPKAIRQPLIDFAEGNCLLVPRLTDDFGLDRSEGNCHFNVNGYVDKFGGEAVYGWLLHRNRQQIEYGMYVFSFHSVWATEENELFDITEDKSYATNSFSTFITDATRRVDFVNGTNYNNITIFADELFAKHYAKSMNVEVEVGTLYWTLGGGNMIKKLSEHSGIYRWLTENYTHNIKLLNDMYGLKIVGNQLKPNAANDKINRDVLFDFSLELAA